MSPLMIILIIILVVVLFGALPGTPWMAGRGWNYGYYPSGIVFIIVVVLIILLLTGRL